MAKDVIEPLEGGNVPLPLRHNGEAKPEADATAPLAIARSCADLPESTQATAGAASETQATHPNPIVTPLKPPAPSSGTEAPDLAAGLELAQATHANLQDMVKVADAKAGALVGIQALALALLMGDAYSRLTKGWEAPGALGWVVSISSTSAFLAFGVSIIFALTVLYPRIRRNEPCFLGARGLLWIEDLLKLTDSPSAYVCALHSTRQSDLVADFAFENLKVSGILKTKFRGLQPAVWLLKGGVIALMIALVATFIVGRTKPANQEPSQSAATQSSSGKSAGNAPSAPRSSRVGVAPAPAL